MTSREDRPELYVLNALADDIEDLSAIMRTLNSDSAIGWHRRCAQEDLARLFTSSSDMLGGVARGASSQTSGYSFRTRRDEHCME